MFFRALLLAGLMGLLPGTSQAALIGLADPVFGAQALLLDTSTGLTYLNLRISRGASYNQTVTQLAPGKQFAGFRYATLAEVTTLFTHAGVFATPGPSFQMSEFTGGELLLSLLGTLFNSAGNFALTSGLTGTSAGPGVNDTVSLTDCYTSNVAVCAPGSTPAGSTNAQLGTYNDTVAYTYLGSFLVRQPPSPVPEPASLDILAGVLAVMAVGQARRRRGPSA